jgi:excisionase family DNA binding protein
MLPCRQRAYRRGSCTGRPRRSCRPRIFATTTLRASRALTDRGGAGCSPLAEMASSGLLVPATHFGSCGGVHRERLPLLAATRASSLEDAWRRVQAAAEGRAARAPEARSLQLRVHARLLSCHSRLRIDSTAAAVAARGAPADSPSETPPLPGVARSGIIESWIAPPHNSRCPSRRNSSMRLQSAWPTSSSIVWARGLAFPILSPTNPAAPSLARMRSAEVAQYLGWSRKSVYRRVARMAMPHYKVDGILLLRRDELDAWLEQYREEPREQGALRTSSGAGRHPPAYPRGCAVARESVLRAANANPRNSRSRMHRVRFLPAISLAQRRHRRGSGQGLNRRFFNCQWAGLESNQRPWD